MLLTTREFEEIAESVAEADSGISGFDFETTSLYAAKGIVFIMGFTWQRQRFSVFTCDPRMRAHLARFFSNPRMIYAAHNAKFELGFLHRQWDIDVAGKVWCTQVMARLQFNNHLKYNLESCAARAGLPAKYEPALKWLKDSKLLHHQMPHEIVVPYVEHDAWLSDELCRNQRQTFIEWQLNSRIPCGELIVMEMQTTKVLKELEQTGLHVNVPLCTEALDYEKHQALEAETEFQKLTGVEFTDSAKALAPVFDSLGIELTVFTPKGQTSVNQEALLPFKDHPVVAQILKYRHANKRASTYWENFLKFQIDGVIYPNINQSVATGRYSGYDPNFQNWPDDWDLEPGEEMHPFPIRRAFYAPDGCVIVSKDYKQMEYRFITDESGDKLSIHAILNDEDIHQDIAVAAHRRRGQAKAAFFARVYGAQPKRIAKMLHISLKDANALCDTIDEKCPGIMKYCRGLIDFARSNGRMGYNYMGRRYHFDPGFEYKYPDYRTQGGCSEILRKAKIAVVPFLKKNAHPMTRVLIPIHDELVFRYHKSDLHLVPVISQMMADAYEHRHVPMAVSVAVGPNFHDLEEMKL
jgi:DNA polymerase-1